MLTVVRHFYAIFLSYFSKHKKHGSGWCWMFSIYISYILLNLWMVGECQAVFVFYKKKHVICKICFLIFLFYGSFVCWKIDLKNPFAAEEVEIISFFLRRKKLRLEREKNQNHKLFYLMLIINKKLFKNIYVHSFNFVFEVKYLDSIGHQITLFFISRMLFKVTFSRLTKLFISILFYVHSMLSIIEYVVTVLVFVMKKTLDLIKIFCLSPIYIPFYQLCHA